MISRPAEIHICSMGTPKGIRAIITTGDVNGIMLNQTATGPSGLMIEILATISARKSGKVTGNMNCCVSDSLSTAEPIAAKRAAYKR